MTRKSKTEIEEDQPSPKEHKAPDALPLHEVDRIAEEWAASFAKNIVNLGVECDDDAITITLATVHGSNKAIAEVKAWDEAGVLAALADIKSEFGA